MTMLMDRTTSVLENVRALIPEISARAAETERTRAVPPDIIEKLRIAGAFRMSLPADWGGDELGFVESAQVIEEIARADASTAWTVMVGSGLPTFISRLPRETLDTVVFGNGADVLVRGAIAPKGIAVPVDGGYLLSGRWPLASGAYRPDWMLAGFFVKDQFTLPDGRPDLRCAIVNPDDVTFIDTWDAVGLRGTQSNDFEMHDVFIPIEHTGSNFAPNNFHAPLYNLPMWPTSPAHTAVVIGLLEGALGELVAVTATKRPAFNPTVVLGEDPVYQVSLGELDIRTAALRALHESQSTLMMERALDGVAPTTVEWDRHRAATQHIHHEGNRIMNEIMALSGSAAIYNTGTLQRRWRDLRCVAQHVAANQGAMQALGAGLAAVSR